MLISNIMLFGLTGDFYGGFWPAPGFVEKSPLHRVGRIVSGIPPTPEDPHQPFGPEYGDGTMRTYGSLHTLLPSRAFCKLPENDSAASSEHRRRVRRLALNPEPTLYPHVVNARQASRWQRLKNYGVEPNARRAARVSGGSATDCLNLLSVSTMTLTLTATIRSD